MVAIGYTEQWERVKRLSRNLTKFNEAESDRFEEASDAFISFCINCYSLKDWLIQSGFDESHIHAAINNSRYLQLVRDISNTQKHMKITRYKPTHSFVNETMANIINPVRYSYDPFSKRSFFGVAVWEYGKPIHIVDLSNGCVTEWQQIINSHHNK